MFNKKNTQFIHRLVSVVALCGILLVQVLPVRAQSAPPPAPTAPPPAPTAPPPSSQPTQEPPAPTNSPPANPSPTSAPADAAPVAPSPSPSEPEPVSDSSVPLASAPGVSDQGKVQNGQSGDTLIATGDATNSGIVISEANTNLAAVPKGSGTGGITVASTGNGAESASSGSVTVSDTNTTNQENSATVRNNLNQTSTTGDNSASFNVGNSAISTGDANVSGTAITAVNTNLAGVSVSEFNIADDHQGDYVLDFAANCISGCPSGETLVSNTGNGADSTNTGQVTINSADATFQTNDATVGNTLVLAADSGNNQTSFNTGGDNAIATGDANVSANALTFANNNVSGNVIFGVVNIYGDLVGDIIFPEELLGTCCGTDVTVANQKNGAGSANTAAVNTTVTDNTFQANEATINNNLVMEATTGDNSTSGNTGGDNLIRTGDTNVTASVLNVANSNVSGGNWWLVLVNEAGKWIGHIIGSPDDANYAGSQGTEFTVGPNGEITAVNSGNGAGSTNTASVTQNTTNTTTQTNTANISNNLDLSANTGGNSANYNTGGDNLIQTGDAQVIANIVNFVNNNISGGGKLFVTVVNVFGSWLGDFVGPGQKKAPTQAQALADNPAPDPVGGEDVTAAASPAESAFVSPDEDGLPDSSVPSSSATTAKSKTVNPAASPAVTTLTRRILGTTAFTFSAAGNDEPEALIASFTVGDIKDAIITPVPTSGRNILHINLAWFLLILPVVGILGLLKFKLRRLPF